MATVIDTGFAEFTAGLLAGVFDALIGAQLDQVRKLDALRLAATLGDEAFAQAYVSDAQVQAAIAARPASGAAPPSDAAAVRLALAQTQRGVLQAALGRGLPRILVDHGRVSARLMFSVEEDVAVAPAASLLTGLGARPRLRVTAVHARGPEFLRLQTQITSEVEITFKSMTE